MLDHEDFSIGSLVLQRWINKWYLGNIVEIKESRVRVHLRGREEEHDKWFPSSHPSIRLQTLLSSRTIRDSQIGAFGVPDIYVRVYITDASVASKIEELGTYPVGKVVGANAGMDCALVQVYNPINKESQVQEIHQSLLEKISFETFVINSTPS